MNSTVITHSTIVVKHFECGYIQTHHSDSVSMIIREDNLVRYEKHYCTINGSMTAEISRKEYLRLLGDIISTEGKDHPYYHSKMTVYVSVTTNVPVYD